MFFYKEVLPPEKGRWEFPLRKVFDKENRVISTLKTDIKTHEVRATGHDDTRKAEKAQSFGIRLKPEKPIVPPIVESVPQESEEAESPDTATGQPEPAEAPPIVDPAPVPEPPKVSPNKSFTYSHGLTIPDHTPERRTDWRRPDGWIPEEWAGVSEAIKEAIYQEWKEKEPEQAQKAYELAQAYIADLEQKREAKAKAEEEKRALKAAKLNSKKGGAPAGASFPDSGKKIVHLCSPDSSFLSNLLGSQCGIRPIHEISNL